MGAKRVEAVTTHSSASCKLEDYDYVLLKDGASIPVRGERAARVAWVNTTWLKDCLITGRLLKQPNIE